MAIRASHLPFQFHADEIDPKDLCSPVPLLGHHGRHRLASGDSIPEGVQPVGLRPEEGQEDEERGDLGERARDWGNPSVEICWENSDNLPWHSQLDWHWQRRRCYCQCWNWAVTKRWNRISALSLLTFFLRWDVDVCVYVVVSRFFVLCYHPIITRAASASC